MGVNHRAGEVLVAQKFLNGANVPAAFQEMGGKRVPDISFAAVDIFFFGAVGVMVHPEGIAHLL